MSRGRAATLGGCIAVTAALALSACGGDAGAGGGDGDRAAGKRQEAALRFAQCMRQNGVKDFPDPDERGGFAITPESDGRANRPAADRARKACDRHLREAGPAERLDEEEQAHAEDRLARFNRCMREHGVELPEPQVDGGQAAQPLGDVNLEAPEFKRANAACERVLREAEGAR